MKRYPEPTKEAVEAFKKYIDDKSEEILKTSPNLQTYLQNSISPWTPTDITKLPTSYKKTFLGMKPEDSIKLENWFKENYQYD